MLLMSSMKKSLILPSRARATFRMRTPSRLPSAAARRVAWASRAARMLARRRALWRISTVVTAAISSEAASASHRYKLRWRP